MNHEADVNDVNKRSTASVQSLILLSELELILPLNLGTSGTKVTAEAEGTRCHKRIQKGGGQDLWPLLMHPKWHKNSTQLLLYLLI